MPNQIKINRAPVMTLWAAVVTERLGFDREEALTLAKAVTGLNAQSKGQRLGLFEPGAEETEKARQQAPGERYFIKVLGRPVPALNTDDGIRAVDKNKPIQPRSVERYLEKKFGEDLPEARQAMEELASSFSPQELAEEAYELYEQFRPDIPEGKRGWGAEGTLDLEQIRSLRR